MLNKEANQNCLCGLEQSYKKCCGRFIESSLSPDTPEQLMRSRFSAYILKNEAYLLRSWHESTRPDSLDLTNDSTRWEKLVVIDTTEHIVHFVAYFTQKSLEEDCVFALVEISQFIKEKNWNYLKGDDVQTIQLTKNMACPCQSGKKYKRCCGKDI